LTRTQTIQFWAPTDSGDQFIHHSDRGVRAVYLYPLRCAAGWYRRGPLRGEQGGDPMTTPRRNRWTAFTRKSSSTATAHGMASGRRLRHHGMGCLVQQRV